MGTSADLMGSSQCHPVYIDNKPYSVQLCPATPAFQALPAPHPAISSSYPEISLDPGGLYGTFAWHGLDTPWINMGVYYFKIYI